MEEASLGAFAKLQKANIIFAMSVRPSAWNNSTPSERNFIKHDIWAFFENLSRKFKFNENLRRRLLTKNCRENQHTFSAQKLFFPKIVLFTRWCGKILYSRTGYRLQYGAFALHAGWLRLQTHTHNTLHLFLFHGNNGWLNTPQYYVTRRLALLLYV